MSEAAASLELIRLSPSLSEGKERTADLAAALDSSRDRELRLLFEKSQRVFDEVASRKLSRWVATFSGGKDSTLTTILAADYLAREDSPPPLDVVYADTLLEIPAMREAAGRFLAFLRLFSRERGTPIHPRIVRPKVMDRYWVRMIGRGYPPPKPKFRWCTRRLKIAPAEPIVSTGRPTAVLTGVRYGESSGRTGRLVASCTTGGECGQDYWAKRGPRGSNVTYFAPIIDWRTCKVWDFLHFVAPLAGWPTEDVYALYGDTSLRFGCWNCTLVRRDRTVETLIAQDPASPLSDLHDFREFMWEESKKRKNRLRRNGHMAALTLEFRATLLSTLLGVQAQAGARLITEAELRAIHQLWEAESRK